MESSSSSNPMISDTSSSEVGVTQRCLVMRVGAGIGLLGLCSADVSMGFKCPMGSKKNFVECWFKPYLYK